MFIQRVATNALRTDPLNAPLWWTNLHNKAVSDMQVCRTEVEDGQTQIRHIIITHTPVDPDMFYEAAARHLQVRVPALTEGRDYMWFLLRNHPFDCACAFPPTAVRSLQVRAITLNKQYCWLVVALCSHTPACLCDFHKTADAGLQVRHAVILSACSDIQRFALVYTTPQVDARTYEYIQALRSDHPNLIVLLHGNTAPVISDQEIDTTLKAVRAEVKALRALYMHFVTLHLGFTDSTYVQDTATGTRTLVDTTTRGRRALDRDVITRIVSFLPTHGEDTPFAPPPPGGPGVVDDAADDDLPPLIRDDE